MGKEKIKRPGLFVAGLTASKTITASSNVTVAGTLTGSSNFSVAGTLTASSNFTVSGTLTGSSNATISGTLTGSSNVTVSGTLTGSSNASVAGTLTGSSNVSVAGTLTASSNASVAGTLTLSSGLVGSVASVSSSQALAPLQVTVLTNTGAVGYTLPAPVAGMEMRIVKTANSTAVLTVATNSTAVTLDGSSGVNLIFNGQNQVAWLQASSTARWLLLSSTGQIGNIT